MATGVSLQESYLRGRGSERSGLRVPAVSRNTHQLTNDPFRSKILLEFKAERLEEHPKPTGVEVEGLETLTGSPETDRLAYKEVIDSHRAPQHMNHIESKVIARRIRIEEPSRLVIRRKLPEEVLQIEMLKHVARVDDLALEMFHGSTVPAIYILFENPSRESTCTLGRLCKIAAIEEYEEWGEWHTVWKLLQLQATATAARTTTVATRATAMTTTTLLSADKWLYKVGGAVRWERDIGWLRRSATNIQAAAIQGTTTICEERQRTVEEKLHNKMRWRYYEWGAQSEGMKVTSNGDEDDNDTNVGGSDADNARRRSTAV
ncbi:hypothetical protein M404DRAFT_23405 [Pisolithus tinctorius Marx 270]|uniref:Uncharacterized protein n=1 Tax=Pisolithus tinctorius Marx 270 TaxID=870435 RepID=A0A0C3PJ28_PISTI|nr:hypothetical protein M404DRAFT_23405 [Pisolithus tinctorius Marx 270]